MHSVVILQDVLLANLVEDLALDLKTAEHCSGLQTQIHLLLACASLKGRGVTSGIRIILVHEKQE